MKVLILFLGLGSWAGQTCWSASVATEIDDDIFMELKDFDPVMEFKELEDSLGDIVSTTSGVFAATKTTSKTNKTVKVFYGIPYAKPPIGELRFRPPQPAERKRKPGFTVADKKGSACFQHGPEKATKLLRKLGYSVPPPYSEDCLTLNIWVPDGVQNGQDLPVMVFIHGGGFYLGSSTDYYSDGATLVSEENVIVVSMNYRLGVLGFLSLGLREEAPGNAGLMDQQLALKWVKNNIGKFGGDPNKVTLFGVSSGSICVGFHILSDGSRGLFQRAIMMSGVPHSPGSLQEPETVKKKSIEAARNLNYKGSDDVYDVLRFLRSKSAEEVSQAGDVCGEERFAIGPTYDGVFLKQEPSEAPTKMTLMMGTTSDEGTFQFISNYPYLYSRYDNSVLDWKDFEYIFKKLDPEFDDVTLNLIKYSYIDHSKPIDDPVMIRDAAIKAIGDYLVNCDTQEFADTFSETHLTVYRYIFDGRANVTENHVPKWSGALHGCDGLLLFGDFLDSNHLPSTYLDFVRDMMKKFANFARTGSPNLSREESRIKADPKPWPLYFKQHRYSMLIRSTGDEEVQHPGVNKCALWKGLIKGEYNLENEDNKAESDSCTNTD